MKVTIKTTAPLSWWLQIMLVLAAGAAAMPVSGQSAASISGTVADQSGAVVPGATITIQNIDTNVEQRTVTDGAGHYAIPSIPPGNYTMSASKAGFATTEVTRIVLSVSQVATFNFSLKPGAVQEKVTVNSEVTQVQTASASLGAVIDTKSVDNLPLNGRNFTQILELTPGVSRINIAQTGGQAPIGQETIPAVNGQRNRSDMFYLDGANDLGSYTSSYNYEPVIDSIQEFKVLTHSDLAQYGQVTGGIVDVVSRSGTNQFHGALWEFLRNSILDAKPDFATAVNPLHQNQFGGLFGGPVLLPHLYNGHNRTFFFFDYEGFRESQAAQHLLTTPTVAQLSGDFSADLANGIQLYDPYSTTPDPANPGKYLRNPFPNDNISSELNPATVLYAKTLFPAPNATGLPGGQNLIDSLPTRNDMNSYSGRIDQSFGQHDLLYGRVSDYNEPFTSSSSSPENITVNTLSGWNITAHEVHTISPRWIAEGYFSRNVGYLSTFSTYPSAPSGFAQSLITAGYSNAYLNGMPGPESPVIPEVQITGYVGANQPTYDGQINSDVWEYGGAVTGVLGRHTVKAGAVFATNNYENGIDAEASSVTSIAQTGNLETPTINGHATGDALASFLVGVELSSQFNNQDVAVHGAWVDGFYGQDQIQVNKHLTVNVGVRWDVSKWGITGGSSPNSQSYYSGNLDLGNGQYYLTALPPACSSTQGAPCIPGGVLPADVELTPYSGRALHKTDLGNWQGRFGFAYHLLAKTSVLGGYGRFYDSWDAMIQNGSNLTTGWPSVLALTTSAPNSNVVTSLITDPFHLGTTVIAEPATPWAISAGVNPTLKTAYSDQWNLGVEQGFGANTVLSLHYVGAVGGNLAITYANGNIATTAAAGTTAQVNARRPWPYISTSRYTDNTGWNNYQALEVSLHKTSSSGLSYLLSYTRSKSEDQGCSGSFASEDCYIQNPYALLSTKAVSAYDLPNIFSASAVYPIPFRNGASHRAIYYVLGGWSVSPIVSGSSGTPFTPKVNGDVANVGGSYVLPNEVSNPKPTNQTASEWFVPSALPSPPAYSFGNFPINSLRTQAFWDADLSIFKSFPIYRESSLEFRADAFDFPNTTVLGTPGTTFGAATYGVVSSIANGPRIAQFSLKYKF